MSSQDYAELINRVDKAKELIRSAMLVSSVGLNHNAQKTMGFAVEELDLVTLALEKAQTKARYDRRAKDKAI